MWLHMHASVSSVKMRKSALRQHSFVYFLSIVVTMVTMFGQSCNGQKDTGYKCPSPSSISHCACRQYVDLSGKLVDNSIVIDCDWKGLSDSQMSIVLNALFSPNVSRVVQILAGWNSLTQIPRQISQFPYLFSVGLGFNQITEIPFSNEKPFLKNRFTNARIYINLQGNQISHIPSGVFSFPNASYVNIELSFGKIVSFASDAFRFPSATEVYIYLHYNQISVIPDGVFNYPNAKVFFISLHNNQISAIPPRTFTNLPQVTEIMIALSSNGRITSIPSGVFNFPYARDVFINLAENSITDIPCGAFNYPFANNAVTIILNANQITAVPSCAFNFPSAFWVEINLNNNSIVTISPGVFNFPSARNGVRLQFKNNRISAIPPNSFIIPRHCDLFLQNNLLKRFESAVFKTPLVNNLQNNYYSIAIDGNPIDCSTDPCHLAWLLQSSSRNQLLSRISGSSVCSSNGGTPFSDLVNSNFDFSKNCPCSYNY